MAGVDSAHGEAASTLALSALVDLDADALDHAVADNLLNGENSHNALAGTYRSATTARRRCKARTRTAISLMNPARL